MYSATRNGTGSVFGKSRFRDGGSDERASSARPGFWERAFFYLSMIVLQGAFLATPRLIQGNGTIADDMTGGDPLNQLSFGLVLAGTAIFMLARWRQSVAGIRSNRFYFALPVLIVLSTAWSFDPMLTLKRGVWTAGVCMFDLYIVMRLDLDDIFKIVSRTVLLSLLASVAIAIALPNVGREVGEGLNGEWRGVFAQKNQLGHVMSVGAIVQLLVMLRANRLKLGAVALFVGCAALMVLSESMTSLMGTIAATAVVIAFVCIRRGMVSAVLGCLAAGALLCLLVGVLAAAGNGSGLGLLDRDSSLTGRTDLWPAVIEMIRMRPWLGWGFESFWSVNNPYFDYVRTQAGWPAPNAHNGLLEIALDTGLAGVTLFMFVLAWMIKRALGCTIRGDLLGIFVLVVLMQLLIGNITESFLLESTIFGWNFLSMLVLRIGIAKSGVAETERQATPILDRAKPRGGIVIPLNEEAGFTQG